MADNKLDKKMETLNEISNHYLGWTEDNDQRMSRKNGWNDVTDAYWGKLPDNWPYQSKVIDPRIQTSLKEKNARLLNSKLRGELTPRDGEGDILKARLQNTIINHQWDNANHGGTMLAKYSMMDLDTRLYSSKFAMVPWLVETDKDGNLLFEGNEFFPKDLRDCGIDPNCQNIRDARWFQLREWKTFDELKRANKKVGVYSNLDELKKAVDENNDRRDTAYTDRLKTNKGLEDRMGTDPAYQVLEIVTEYRPDRWITFSPKHNIILRDIPNPYDHKKIPFVQLKYYPLGEDPLGESEVEPVLPIWRAIQAVLNGYLDNMQLHVRPPLKIIEGMVRIETIKYGPEAQWLMDTQDAVQELQGSTDPMRHFQTTYSALVSAFNTAMGDLSQGTSQIDQFNPEKTATEVKQTARQQLVRDQKNQTVLIDVIKDMMSMWISNNRQFLFLDPNKKEHIMRIVGPSQFEYFRRAGLDEMELTPEASQMIQDIIQTREGDVDDEQLLQLMEAGKTPKFPIVEGKGKNMKIKPKMELSPLGDEATISVVPEDLEGNYDYIPDVKSMAQGSSEEYLNAKISALQMSSNPQILQLLMQEGWKPKVKDLLVNIYDEQGNKDSEKYFEPIGPAQPGAVQSNGPGQAQPEPGLPTGTPPIPQNPGGQQMGGSFDMQK